MKTVVLYEFVSSGGLWRMGADAGGAESLAREGRGMLTALAADFAAMDGVRTIVLRDARWGTWSFAGCDVCDVDRAAAEETLLRRLSSEAEGTVVIAPEFDGLLEERCRWVEGAGGQLLGPSAEVVAIGSSKHLTAEVLAGSGVLVPNGMVLQAGDSFPRDFKYPAVLKPVDGCGSQKMWLIESSADEVCLGGNEERRGSAWRLEEFVPGIAASVAVLCGPGELRPLPACRQRLSADGRFRYLGGALPLPAELARRAQKLAVRAVGALPGVRGYVGVDLVLGDDALGAGDVVIEINPRLTTSYIGLREAAKGNLAEAMWAIAEGREGAIEFGDEEIEFDSDGVVRRG